MTETGNSRLETRDWRLDATRHEASQFSRRILRQSQVSSLRSLCAIATVAAIALGGCGTTAKAPPQRGGGYYLDDGPGLNPPANLDSIPDAVPRVEPLHRGAARPYTVMGRSYTPMTSLGPYRARGVATWYGRRYHGRQTSVGETYDMYAMTAAHTTLPIPSYARVTNPANGRSVVVRVNDRGPFVGDRLIDLSYAAAHRLGLIAAGSGMVDVESILPGVPATAAPQPVTEPAPMPVAPDATPVVAVVAPPPPSAVELPSSSAHGTAGIYLQFGAFGSRENAESLLGRLQAQAGWLSQILHVHAQDGLHRVRAGPYSTREDARLVAERLAEAHGIKALIIAR